MKSDVSRVLRSIVRPLAVAVALIGSATGQTTIVEGMWEFRAGNAAPFPIAIRRTDGYKFTGLYAGNLVFNGTGSSNDRVVMINWVNASPNIPGSSLPFWGTLSGDGKSVSNGYAALCQTCTRGAMWSARWTGPEPVSPATPSRRGTVKGRPSRSVKRPPAS